MELKGHFSFLVFFILYFFPAHLMKGKGEPKGLLGKANKLKLFVPFFHPYLFVYFVSNDALKRVREVHRVYGEAKKAPHL